MKLLLGAVLAFGLSTGVSYAQDLVTIQVGYSPGGSYDQNARAVAEFLGRYLPGNPEVIVENVPGAGSLALAKQVMNDSNPDGSKVASVSSALALAPVFDPQNLDFDPRQVHYIASLSSQSSYCIAHKQSGLETFEQFLASETAKVGATGRSSTTYTFSSAIKVALDGKFQIVTGFEGANEIDLALERGDIQVRCGIGASDILAGDTLERYNVLGEMGLEPRHEIEGPVFVLDLVKDETRRAALQLVFASSSIHHPLLVPPNTSAEVVDMLRAAVVAVSEDSEFQELNASRGLYITITPGNVVEAKILEFLSAPEEVRVLAQALVQ